MDNHLVILNTIRKMHREALTSIKKGQLINNELEIQRISQLKEQLLINMNTNYSDETISGHIVKYFSLISFLYKETLAKKVETKYTYIDNQMFNGLSLGLSELSSSYFKGTNIDIFESTKLIDSLTNLITKISVTSAYIAFLKEFATLAPNEKKNESLLNYYSTFKKTEQNMTISEDEKSQMFFQCFGYEYQNLMKIKQLLIDRINIGKKRTFLKMNKQSFEELKAKFNDKQVEYINSCIFIIGKDSFSSRTDAQVNLSKKIIYFNGIDYIIACQLVEHHFMQLFNLEINGSSAYSFFDRQAEKNYKEWLSKKLGKVLQNTFKERISGNWEFAGEEIPSSEWALSGRKGVDLGDIDLVIVNEKLKVVLFCESKWKTPSYFDIKSKNEAEKNMIKRQEDRQEKFAEYCERKYKGYSWKSPILTFSAANSNYINNKIFFITLSSFVKVLSDYEVFEKNFLQ